MAREGRDRIVLGLGNVIKNTSNFYFKKIVHIIKIQVIFMLTKQCKWEKGREGATPSELLFL